MGTVYRANQLSLNRPVAIKILPPHLAANPSYVARFRQEAKAAAQLRHSHMVQIFDAGEDQGLYYFVMELINGETVGQRVQRKGRLDEESTLLIGESVAAALDYAWAQASLVHRDVKPDNILIDSDGTVKIADLGLAKLRDNSAKAITMAVSFVGTPHYCAPEQAKGDTDVDFRADIYALGATLYHLVTGSPPFPETSGVSAMVKHITESIPDPMDVNPTISESFAWLVETMMAKNKAKRYPRWEDVLTDIDGVLHHQPLTARPLPVGASTILRSARRKAPIRLDVEEDSSEETERSGSRFFHFFLAISAIFTVLLYVLWFGLSTHAKSHRPLPVAKPSVLQPTQ